MIFASSKSIGKLVDSSNCRVAQQRNWIAGNS